MSWVGRRSISHIVLNGVGFVFSYPSGGSGRGDWTKLASPRVMIPRKAERYKRDSKGRRRRPRWLDSSREGENRNHDVGY